MSELRDRYVRTACACAECVRCCHEQPGPLAPGDVERILEHLGVDATAASAFFWASPGAVVRDRLTGRTRMIGTITPRLEAGRCVFLDDADRCRVHAVAPFGCSHVDTHMPRAWWQGIASALYTAVERSDAYRALRRTLPAATSWRPRG